MNDILNLLNPKHRFTATASYYDEPMNSPEDGAQQFNYEYVSPFSNTYRRLFANIQGTAGEVAIRTDDQLKFRTGALIITQDGKAFEILQSEKDFQSANKQALRLFGTPLSVEYVLRLVEVKNPWGLK